MGIITFISSRNYIALNKTLMKEYGLHEAILLGELASEYEYWAEREQITDDGFFYSTVENVKENTTLSDSQQRKAIASLKKQGVLDVALKGIPAKRFFKINENALLALLNAPNNASNNLKPCSSKIEELELQKVQTNKNNITKTENENKKDISSESAQLRTIAKEIIDYLNAKANKNYRLSNKTTQQHIHARLAEGFTVEDFKTVIDKKSAEWMGTNFEQYLRPVTLFGSKFESYLNAPAFIRKTVGTSGVEIAKPENDDLAGIL